jgi:hypothetical protein
MGASRKMYEVAVLILPRRKEEMRMNPRVQNREDTGGMVYWTSLR